MKLKWINNFTGQLFKSLPEAIITAILDMRIKQCRSFRAFDFSRIN